MKREVYMRSWKTNSDSCMFCVPKDCEDELNAIFSEFRYRLNIANFDDEKSVCLKKQDYTISDREFWYLVLTLLKDNGYEFSLYASNRYEWYKNEYLKIKEQKRLEQENQELKIQEKEQLDSEYGLFCNKQGCLTNISFCINKCKYNIQYDMNCRPERVKIKKEGI